MGGERVAAGVDILNRAGIPTFAFPDDAARAFCDMGRFADNLRALYETPVPQDRRRRSSRPRCDAIIDGARAEGSDAARRGGSQGGARQLRHPGRADARGRATRRRRSRRRARSASRSRSSSGRASITHKTDVGGVKLGLADDAGRGARVRRHPRGRRSRRAGARRLPRRHRAADGRSQRGPRADPGQHRRSAARAGAAVRRGRRAGRGVARSRAGAAAADDDAGAPADRRDADRARAARRSRPAARRSRRRSRRCSCASAIWSPSSAGSARSTSTRCWRRRTASSRWTRASSCTIPALRDAELPRPAIRPYPTEYVWTEASRDGTPVHDPADPPRRRAADGRVSRDALRGERPAALHARVQARSADGARAADPGLLRRLRPRDGAGRGGRTPPRAGARSPRWVACSRDRDGAQRRRVRAAGRRSVAAARDRPRAAAPPRRGRAPRADDPRLRRHPASPTSGCSACATSSASRWTRMPDAGVIPAVLELGSPAGPVIASKNERHRRLR